MAPDGGQDGSQRLGLGRRQLRPLGSSAPPAGLWSCRRPARPFTYVGRYQAAPDQAGRRADPVALSGLRRGQLGFRAGGQGEDGAHQPEPARHQGAEAPDHERGAIIPAENRGGQRSGGQNCHGDQGNT